MEANYLPKRETIDGLFGWGFFISSAAQTTQEGISTEAELSNMLNLNSTEPTMQSIEIPKQNWRCSRQSSCDIHMLDTYQQVNRASPWTCQSSCTCSPQSWRPVPSKIQISISANITWCSYNCEQVNRDSQPQGYADPWTIRLATFASILSLITLVHSAISFVPEACKLLWYSTSF